MENPATIYEISFLLMGIVQVAMRPSCLIKTFAFHLLHSWQHFLLQLRIFLVLIKRRPSGVLLPLGNLLSIASYHDHAQEAPYDGAADQDEDDGDTDGPDAWGEEGMEEMVIIHEGLFIRWVSEVPERPRERERERV